MPDSPVLGLPLLAAAQAQKHVTHNEALLALDALVQCAVLDKDLTVPPSAPAPGQRYIVPPGASGAWAGKAAMIAAWQDAYGWRFFPPSPGYIAFVVNESLLYLFNGTGWTSLTSGLAAIQNLQRLGIGTDADATNPFAAKLNKALWTARTVAEGGDGDLRYMLNKETAADVVSLLFQTGFSGRLEFGLIGSDDPAVKVSSDGAAWHTALAINSATGTVDFRAGSTDIPSASTTDLGAVPTLKVRITGTVAITSFGSGLHKLRLIRFAGALTLTHDATSLVLPGSANITTAAGDRALAASDGSGNWTVWGYWRADGTPLAVRNLRTADGNGNTAVGLNALVSLTSGTNNTATGVGALNVLTSGSYNAAFGRQALAGVTTGGSNAACGTFAGFAVTTGSNNAALGYSALPGVTSGGNDTAVGALSLSACTTGGYNTALGYNSLSGLTTFDNATGVGANAAVTGSNQVQLGDSATTTYCYGAVQNRSDGRDKADIRDTALGLQFLLALRPVDFRWDLRDDYRSPPPARPASDAADAMAAHGRELAAWAEANRLSNIVRDGSKTRIRRHQGLIAQEVKAAMHELGVEFGGYQDHSLNGGEDVVSLGYEELVPVLIKAVQELHRREEAMAAEITALAGRLAALEAQPAA
ncbi:DUF2793 domain-containing protein [Enterovirga sp.]|uniref:DUF2793 domain-containing protein n=1 Tax=Enterovirga sp. TaxID=2026350 RepID=UPI00260885A6|nr:DUF2793 domain-containing protein [Enterovirga sp.]MDB5590639.1 hypothetical protein [Enterovirga sp.]